MEYQALLFYKYIYIKNPEKIANWLRGLAQKNNLLGRVIVAKEGINATFEGELGNAQNFLKEFKKEPKFADIDVKTSQSDGNAFPKLSVKVRPEIVGTHFSKNEADPTKKTGKRISPKELREWYKKKKDFTVVDMRNDYEYVLGHFSNSVEPGLRASRDLPKAIKKIEHLKDKTVITVCTGGVRCEKMSAYLLSKGFKNVYQLEGGIHSYMEKYPGKDFLGSLYTFDNRIAMDFGGDREVIGKCLLCGATSEQYVNCYNDDCHLHFIACDNCYVDEKVFCSDNCRLNCRVGKKANFNGERKKYAQ